MKQKNLIFFIATIVFIIFGLLGCSSKVEKKEETKKGMFEVSKENPIYVDKENKVVKVYATVNGKYLVTPTRHGLNWIEGKFGDQAVLKAYGNPLKFNEALIQIGALPAVEKGGDVTKEFEETPEGKFIKGDEIDVTITWDGADKEYSMNDVMVDSSGKTLKYRFGGNYDTQEKVMTGCYMCFDSCAAGITSNSSHPVGTFESKKAEFHGDPDVLPADGTPVVLTYSLVR